MREEGEFPDPREDDIMAGDRRISRPDSSLPDWYISDASYRPIPIAWFAAAIVIQAAAISILFFATINQSGWVSIGLSLIATLGIGIWSWDRGVGSAATGWKLAMVLVMALQFGFIALGASDRL